MAPKSTSPILLRALYRSLLRTSTPFTSPTWSSLLHRSGLTHDWHECIYRLDMTRKRRNLQQSRVATNPDEDPSTWTLPKDWAMNLSRSYADLKEEYTIRRDFFQNRYPYGSALDTVGDDDALENDEEYINMTMGSSNYKTTEWERKEMYGSQDEDYENAKIVLFRHLFREYLSGVKGCADILKIEDKRLWSMDEDGFLQNGEVRSVPLMRWPCKIDESELSLRDLIRREFRAPSVEERIKLEELAKFVDESTTEPVSMPENYFPPSSYIDDHIRVQTAFHALMVLNRKLAWGRNIGLMHGADADEVATRQRKRRLQAAKGVTLIPEATAAQQVAQDTSTASESTTNTQPNTCPLQCGTYLIAHPLMTGYFAKTVIIILDHSTSDDTKSQDEDGPGGTYGLIINRLALQPISQEKRLEILRQKLEERMHEMKESGDAADTLKHSSILLDIMKPTSSVGSALQRPISLIQAVQSSDLPESVQDAFGDSPLRDGGPVNFSLQMLHRRCNDTNEDLSKHKNEANGAAQAKGHIDSAEVQQSERRIGGTQLPDDTMDTDAIYFGGDVVKASLAVAEGSADQADFSFVVGASCWQPGQLQREIERGCWLPFRGPANMAMTGMCEHNDVLPKTDNSQERAGEKPTMLSMYPPRPSNSTTMKHSRNNFHERPSSDLWLSIMCALGEGEGELAYAFQDEKNVIDDLGDTCDNFRDDM